ncbi:sigma-54-dependent transcriptional regulator [Polymorphobacter fuscus]|uniref:Response regulator n=1 Tax=Sandarakinorhabdus fusca TaxID=1439888 RepID=A0A7C9GR85_9SPHN|nr:sigma-54 dependent transcriptional regulator [Polymorphobacter fuscus]KAB7644431.1 sigma-54-dependent Fis family transcriptional regulator [Polymorphobacter fuscus]MQT18353.1 response regulator [Polymorphobacter fuscus]NJC08253.1 DNA-binding NtrC family response regulator [Polymorphobacter fuscus]
MAGTALIIDDDADVALSARLLLRPMFANVVVAHDPAALPALMTAHDPDVILLDMNFARGQSSGAEGFKALEVIRARDPNAVVVVITAYGGVNIAVEAMKRGATDFVTKPWDNERLVATVTTAAALRASRREATVAEAKVAEVTNARPDSPLLGSSPAMRSILALIDRVAPTDANVLVLGENGTGKELIARELHARSKRAGKPFLSVDLGAVAESLFDSELFGHVKGAFTDARTDRIGRFQAADGGTLFLDEIGNLPLNLQPKLLTALEQRRVTPVGSNRDVGFDVRVIAATNMSAAALADERRFRPDLLFRLNTVEILLPPLRERAADVPLLLRHYLALYARKYGKPLPDLPEALAARLATYDWPGNVRALRHAAERAVILATGARFGDDDFPLPQRAPLVAVAAPTPAETDMNLERSERRIIERALQKHAWNISTAANELGLTRASLYRRMEKHGL